MANGKKNGNGKLKLAKELDDTDLHILRHLMQTPKLTDTELGQLVGLSREAINRRRKNPRLIEQARILALEAIELFRRSQGEAAQIVLKHMRSPTPTISLDAAKTVLKFAEKAEEDYNGATLTIKLQTDFDKAIASIEVKEKSARDIIDIN